MHPIEHLRYVARARGADAGSLVRETAVALGSLRADHSNLVIAARRIVERHPEAGTLWWLCARLLTADDPTELAWELADQVEGDMTARVVAGELPDAATVVTIGWPEVAGAALMRRGDVTVRCADSRFEASSFMQRLERVGVECEPVPHESLAPVIADADVVMVEAVAACAQRVLAPIGSHVVAAVATSVGTPVWLVAGLGRRLPPEYVSVMAERSRADTELWDLEVDDLPIGLITHVGAAEGVVATVPAAFRSDCAFAPELLRSSAF